MKKNYESTGKNYCSTFHIQWNLSFRMKRRKQDTMLEVTDKWDCYVIKSVKRRHFPPCNNGQRSLHALNVVSGNKKDQSNFSLSIQGGNNRIYKSFILNNGYWQCKGIFHHSIDCVMFCKKERNWFLSGGIVKAPNITPKKSISSDNINFALVRGHNSHGSVSIVIPKSANPISLNEEQYVGFVLGKQLNIIRRDRAEDIDFIL